MSGDGTIDPKLTEIAGAKAAESDDLTSSPDARKIPTAKTFIGSYEKKFVEIGPYSMYARDVTNVLLNAIREAGTKDSKAIIEKLNSMEFSGAVGKIKFDAKGDITITPYIVWITKNGKFKKYWKP